MEKDILFYQANFDPEMNRLLKALDSNNQRDISVFKEKTLKIINKIISLSVKASEKEEWSTILSMVNDVENTDGNQRQILSKYGAPFSSKFMSMISSSF